MLATIARHDWSMGLTIAAGLLGIAEVGRSKLTSLVGWAVLAVALALLVLIA